MEHNWIHIVTLGWKELSHCWLHAYDLTTKFNQVYLQKEVIKPCLKSAGIVVLSFCCVPVSLVDVSVCFSNTCYESCCGIDGNLAVWSQTAAPQLVIKNKKRHELSCLATFWPRSPLPLRCVSPTDPVVLMCRFSPASARLASGALCASLRRSHAIKRFELRQRLPSICPALSRWTVLTFCSVTGKQQQAGRGNMCGHTVRY